MIRFNKDTQVLLFDGARRGKPHWVLYPVYCWSVLVPLPKNRRPNIFSNGCTSVDARWDHRDYWQLLT